MNKRFILLLASTLTLVPRLGRSETPQQAVVHAAVRKQYARLVLADARPQLRARLQPAVRGVIKAATVAPGATTAAPDLMAVARAEIAKLPASTPGALGGMNLSGGDIEAACFIVLMGAVNDTDKDLEMQMAATKALTDAKACARSQACIDQLKTVHSAAAAQQATQAWAAGPAALQSASDMASLQLQMTQDRLSKLLATLSNVLKKISDTGDSVVQNLK